MSDHILGMRWAMDKDLGKNLELDFGYVFVSTNVDLQTKLRMSTKPNFIILAWNSLYSPLVTQSKQLINYRTALHIKITDSCLRRHSKYLIFYLKDTVFTSQNLTNWVAFHIWCLRRINAEKDGDKGDSQVMLCTYVVINIVYEAPDGGLK
jgi:hypothetical protein